MTELKNIYKYFYSRGGIFPFAAPKRTTALEKIDLAISPGEIFTLLGPNGAGKTTLLKIICGLLVPDSGSVAVNGRPGYLGGDLPGFYPQLTGRQNLEFFAAVYDIPPEQTRERIKKYLPALKISSLDKPFWHYSTGTKHKLALLRLLVIDSEIMTMDEPTKSLDPLSANEFRKLLAEIVKQFRKTVVLASHSLVEAETLSDRLAIIDKGKIVFRASRQELAKAGDLENIYLKIAWEKDEDSN